jgi:hypothetical protein
VEDSYLSGLNDEQKREWRKEEERMRNHECGTGWGPPPKCPMHDQVKEMTRRLEQQLTAQVRAEMSEKDREELDKGFKDLHKQYQEDRGMAPVHVPDSVENFYKLIARAADDPYLHIPKN